MTISKAIFDFAGALAVARTNLADVNAKIAGLEEERRSVERAKPHTDDIVEAFMRGLKSAKGEFERQFKSRLASSFVTADDAANTVKRTPFDLMRLEENRPDGPTVAARSARGEPAPLNLFVLTYFLREQIAAEIPALVARLCPAAGDGMKDADRQHALKQLDQELEILRAERDALLADIQAAREAVRP